MKFKKDEIVWYSATNKTYIVKIAETIKDARDGYKVKVIGGNSWLKGQIFFLPRKTLEDVATSLGTDEETIRLLYL